jgi:UDP-N-acetylmuramoyl-tripeptide--D-alanyl-D-alanine ligase
VIPRSVQFLADACGARVLAGDAATLIHRVSTDSRQAGAGDLFVALAGEKFDGHSFLDAAMDRGVAGVLVERRKVSGTQSWPSPVAALSVENTRLALGRMAGRYRDEFSLPITVVGGSNGKTTTKELLAGVLRQKFNTLWSEASFNNDIGVPLTLLRLDTSHQAAVLEVGTNHPGELAPLLDMIRPRYGVITSIGREHLEFFGSLEGVIQEEGTIGERLPSNGKMFIHGDGFGADELARRACCPVVRVGMGERNDWRALEVRVGENGVEFAVAAPDGKGSGEYRVQLLGQHQVTNALLALAVGTELGISPEQLRQGLLECAPPKMRMQLFEVNGVRILDDSYNANADSVIAALQTLASLPCRGRRIAVLGAMAELGSHALPAHEEVGRATGELGIDCLFAVGEYSSVTADAARRTGLAQVVEFPDVASASAGLPDRIRPGDVVLLKASRSTGLEKVVEMLRKSAFGNAGT